MTFGKDPPECPSGLACSAWTWKNCCTRWREPYAAESMDCSADPIAADQCGNPAAGSLHHGRHPRHKRFPVRRTCTHPPLQVRILPQLAQGRCFRNDRQRTRFWHEFRESGTGGGCAPAARTPVAGDQECTVNAGPQRHPRHPASTTHQQWRAVST